MSYALGEIPVSNHCHTNMFRLLRQTLLVSMISRMTCNWLSYFSTKLQETLTGNVPFHELVKDTAVCAAILFKKRIPARPEEHLPTNSKLNNMLWSLLKRCWAFEPEHRPSAKKVRDEVGVLGEDYSTIADNRRVTNL